MKKVDIPRKFPIAFGQFADTPYIDVIPVDSQIGLQPGRASLYTGFVPVNMQQIAEGGIPPYGQDTNGILFQSTSWDRWLSVGGPVYYDADFATGSGGYPAEAIIRSRIVVGNLWMSTVDDNVSDPDAFGAGWISPPFAHGTGDVRGNPMPNDVPAGWVPMKSGFTLGAAGSTATYASADAVFLYVKTWNKFSNAICPVTGGRGANALADFNALKPIQIYDGSGAGMVGNDNGTGRLTGVPVIAGNATTTGSLIGENLHALTANENGTHGHTGTTGIESASHAHGVNGTSGVMNQSNPHAHGTNANANVGGMSGGGGNQPGTAPAGATIFGTDINHNHNINIVSDAQNANHTHNITTANSGLGTPHNNVSRDMVVDWLQKL
jgi:hypothetical protein